MTNAAPTPRLPLKRLLLRGFAWTFVQSVGGLLVQLVTLIILSRLLTPSDFGTVAIAVSLIGGLILVVELGVGPALIQRPAITPRHVGSAIWLSFSLALVLLAALQLAAHPLATWIGIGEDVAAFRALTAIVLLQPLVTIVSAIARRNLEMREAAAADLIGTALGYGAVSITLALCGFGLWALVIAQISQLGVTLLVLFIYQRKKLSLRLGRPEIHDVLSFGAYFSVGRLANYAAQKFDRALIGSLLGSEAAGYYQRALNMLQLVGPLLAGPLDAILFPLLSKVQEDAARLRRSYRASTAVAAMLTMPLSILLCVSAPVIVPLVLGPQWYGTIVPAQILSGLLFFRTNDSITATLIRATGRVKARAALQVLYAALSLGSIWLLKGYGLQGIATGLLVVTILNFVLMSFLVRRVTSMTLADNVTPLVPGALIALCVALLAGGFYLLLGPSLFTVRWMGLYLLLSALLYAALALAIPASLLPREVADLRTAAVQTLVGGLRVGKPARGQLKTAEGAGRPA